MRYEYPRADFVREEWLTLNGDWRFFFDDGSEHKIQVPFVYQCEKSGINDQRISRCVTYQREFALSPEWRGNHIILHFGAVDYQCKVYLNDFYAGGHVGGHTPFQLDITNFVNWNLEKISVVIEDFPTDETIARGKQFWLENPKFIWYTGSTGIWQSVWIEPQPEASFEWIRFTPDVDEGQVKISYRLSNDTPLSCCSKWKITLHEKTYFSGELICSEQEDHFTVTVFGNHVLSGPFHFEGLCWSPDNPILFDVTAQLLVDEKIADTVKSYFGMRKITIENRMLYLNNHPYYPKLILDQGYWKESLLTAPTDEAFKADILRAKSMGFNGCRKHEKVEDPRFLYWADQLGFLVWGGMASFISYTPDTAAQFMREWVEVLQRDYNHPSIIVWDMLNESWGVPQIYHNTKQQHYSLALYHLAHSLDSTRLVISNDGWEMTETDICAIHSYRHGASDDPLQQQVFANCLKDWNKINSGKIIGRLPFVKGYHYKDQPVILTEFGGICGATSEDGWGYTCADSEEEFLSSYRRLIEALHDSEIICGFCYTQLADVQQETNGLLDHMHEFKYDPEKIREINQIIKKGRN
ncbi:MAG: glycoside hydrolase family 2 sugar binding protein [Bacillota bacterium]|nr:glycoside hydrolase family 2 sugar binding protein [Bacillota bacterium]